jgi:predicted RNA-binding protein with PIN domain
MTLVRILVDGYSLLQSWPELAPGKPRQSAAAREALIDRLVQYEDAAEIPLTLVFEGTSEHSTDPPSTPAVQILYTHIGQTVPQLLERLLTRWGREQVVVVTDDFAGRTTVESAGGQVWGCRQFIETVAGALDELEREITCYNQRERLKFQQTS